MWWHTHTKTLRERCRWIFRVVPAVAERSNRCLVFKSLPQPLLIPAVVDIMMQAPPTTVYSMYASYTTHTLHLPSAHSSSDPVFPISALSRQSRERNALQGGGPGFSWSRFMQVNVLVCWYSVLLDLIICLQKIVFWMLNVKSFNAVWEKFVMKSVAITAKWAFSGWSWRKVEDEYSH